MTDAGCVVADEAAETADQRDDTTDDDPERTEDVHERTDAEGAPDDVDAVDTSHLDDMADGCGCAEVWEHLSERREASSDEPYGDPNDEPRHE